MPERGFMIALKGIAPQNPTRDCFMPDAFTLPKETSATCHFGLLGYPLEHSHSPFIHQEIMKRVGLQGQYELLERSREALEAGAIAQFMMQGIQGFNVTIPYKVLMFEKLEALTPMAQRVGAVNTVMMFDVEDHITLVGHNTDATGFFRSLPPETRTALADGNVLILGGGGATRAVMAALAFENTDAPAAITLALRDATRGEDLLHRWNSWREEAPTPLGVAHCIALQDLTPERLERVDVVINTTPVGMHPEPNALPLSLNQLHELPSQAHVIDLIYNPLETLFMREARQHGCTVVINGLGMLVHQAMEAFTSWTKLPLNPAWAAEIEEALKAHILARSL
jgi:shikimate dehydrogenase